MHVPVTVELWGGEGGQPFRHCAWESDKELQLGNLRSLETLIESATTTQLFLKYCAASYQKMLVFSFISHSQCVGKNIFCNFFR